MAKAKRQKTEIEQYRDALKNLVDACGYVQPLTGKMDATTVQDVRKILKFVGAHNAAKKLLGED